MTNKIVNIKDARPKHVSVTFCYCLAFIKSYKFFCEHTLLSMTVTNYIICAVDVTYKLAEKFGVIVDGQPNPNMFDRFEKLRLYEIKSRKKTRTVLNIMFNDKHVEDFAPDNDDMTSFKLPEATVNQLNVLAKVWGCRNRSILIANTAVIYTMLINEQYQNHLTPFLRAKDDIDMHVVWRAVN